MRASSPDRDDPRDRRTDSHAMPEQSPVKHSKSSWRYVVPQFGNNGSRNHGRETAAQEPSKVLYRKVPGRLCPTRKRANKAFYQRKGILSSTVASSPTSWRTALQIHASRARSIGSFVSLLPTCTRGPRATLVCQRGHRVTLGDRCRDIVKGIRVSVDFGYPMRKVVSLVVGPLRTSSRGVSVSRRQARHSSLGDP